MSAIKLTADSGGGTVELKAPATTTGNAALQFKLPVADGTSGQALTTNASGQLAFSTVAGGISELDCYRISSTFQGNAYHITSNWERFDASGEGKKGTGVSESGGYFTFPSTGYYYIEFSPTFYRGANSTIYNQFAHIRTTTNNSSYSERARGASSFYSESGNSGTGAHTSTIFKCENTSTHKVIFGVEVEQYVYTYGSTANNQSHVIFIKLADI
tara:strand:+ start:744 stop:1388 length:645 start_codon:yes stop_codon:yes gene_type:complete